MSAARLSVSKRTWFMVQTFNGPNESLTFTQLSPPWAATGAPAPAGQSRSRPSRWRGGTCSGPASRRRCACRGTPSPSARRWLWPTCLRRQTWRQMNSKTSKGRDLGTVGSGDRLWTKTMDGDRLWTEKGFEWELNTIVFLIVFFRIDARLTKNKNGWFLFAVRNLRKRSENCKKKKFSNLNLKVYFYCTFKINPCWTKCCTKISEIQSTKI